MAISDSSLSNNHLHHHHLHPSSSPSPSSSSTTTTTNNTTTPDLAHDNLLPSFSNTESQNTTTNTTTTATATSSTSLTTISPSSSSSPSSQTSPTFHIPDSTATSQTFSSSTESLSHPKNRQSTFSTSSSHSASRNGFFALATLARDKTSSAIASFVDPKTIRPRPSVNSLLAASSSSLSSPALPHFSRGGSCENFKRPDPPPRLSSSNDSVTTQRQRGDTRSPVQRQSLLETNPPSQAYESTDSNTPPPILRRPGGNYNKMHQTSSRLLRMTDDERPFTRDFKDLFATLVVSLPLAPHRVRLSRIDHSFLSEEAINNLGSLKFSQSNRMPDPKDPSRIVTTTTTTTFSMAREMARSVCQRFLEARFVESADGKQQKEFTMRGSVWQLTPKGIHVLDRFCSRNGIQQKHIQELLNSPRNTMQLVILERDSLSDKLSADRSMIEVIFRRFIGITPNIKNSTSSADSDSLSEYKDGLLGVKMASERKIGSPPRTVLQTFTGKAATDWLMDCCTVVDRRETTEIATLFIECELIWCVQIDRQHAQLYPHEAKFQATKNAIYQVTQKGKDVVNMVNSRVSHGDEPAISKAGVSRDSNTQKLDKILTDPALRLLFRENLRDTHCEENLSFYLDVDEFLRGCKAAVRGITQARTTKNQGGMDAIKETMASAYGIYNAFLAPGSPCELNIDHLLRNQLATRMTKSVGVDQQMIDSLKEVTKLFEEAQISVFKLMASDSVPKFMKNAKYEQTLRNYEFDSAPTMNGSSNNSSRSNTIAAPPERSLSKSQR